MSNEYEQTEDIIMTHYQIENVRVIIVGTELFTDSLSDEEMEKYINYINTKIEEEGYNTLSEIKITELPYNMVKLEYYANGPKFNRLRRITGKPLR